MPVGTSDGEYFDDQYDYTVRRGVINPDVDPRFMTNDQNVVHPNQLETGKEVDKMETDPQTGTGIPIGLKRVEITGGTIDSTMPLEASTEPAGAFKSGEGGQVASEDDVIRPEPFGLNPPEGNAIQSYINDRVKALRDLPQTIRDIPETFKRDMEEYGKKTPEQRLEEAINIGMGVGPGIFQGIKSKIFDKNLLAQAQILEQKGFAPDDIWVSTGVFKGADGRWRQEINDSKATVNPKAFVMREAEHIGPGGKKVTQQFGPSLEDILDHPELYKAYPDLKNIEVLPFESGQYGRASYNSNNDTIQLGKNFNVDDVLHEVQHAIQKREGFAKGGSPAAQFALRFEEEVRIAKIEANQLLEYRKSDDFKGWTKEDEGRIQELKRLFEIDALRKGLSFKEAEEQYMRLAGEVEARNVETRGVLNANARREIPPWLTEDTIRNLQTVINEPMWTTPYGPTKTPMKAPD